jgi:hypothetical protein
MQHAYGSAEDVQGFLAAADGLALLGGGSLAMPAEVDRLLESSYPWYSVAAAVIAWHTAGDADTAVPTLARAWSAGHFCRLRVAELAAAIGPRASALEGLPNAELTSVRRHNRLPGSNTYSSTGIQVDEALLKQVRAALASIAGSDPLPS